MTRARRSARLFARGMEVPVVTVAEMRQVDALLTGSMGMHLVQLMESAGFALAQLTVHWL